MFIKGQSREASWSLIPVSIYILYNIFLAFLFRRGTIYYWVRYVSVIIDVGVLTLHIFVYSTFFSELAVAVTASIFIYFILMFLAVLRYDRKLVIFATLFVLFCFNLNYYLRIGNVDPELIDQVVSADRAGHFYKSMYMALFGFMLLHIPRLVTELVTRQEGVLADKKESEIKLAVEKMEKQFLAERLDFEKDANTELAKQKQQIEEQNRELQQLLSAREKLQSVISHDLRNPFTVIQSLTESLNENLDGMGEEDIRRAVHTLHDTNRRGLYLLDNLLNWTRLQTGKLKVDATVIPVYAVVTNMLEYFTAKCSEKNIRIRNEIEPALSLFCDEDMYRTILRNIISNALKFTPENGTIRIYGKSEEGSTTVCIEDNGVGISGNNLKRILRFDESFSTPGTANEKGSGLGFSLIREFVEMNRGTFSVESEEGKGTVVCLTFPESPDRKLN
jgi:signal transduction histidine kinase